MRSGMTPAVRMSLTHRLMVRIANPRDGRLRMGTQERSKAGKRLGGALTTSIGLRPEWPPSNVQQFNCIDCDLLTRHRSCFRLGGASFDLPYDREFGPYAEDSDESTR